MLNFPEKKLNEEFLIDYQEFCRSFDEIAKDLFQGIRLEQLAKEFLNNHWDYMTKFPFPSLATRSSNFSERSYDEVLDEDLRLIRGDLRKVNYDHDTDGGVGRILGDIFRRACQACYLRVTYNKSRLRQEDDRREAVDLGRRAIRYDPNSFTVCYWYMIAVGWQLDVTRGPKERTLISQLFKETAHRCIELNPTDALAHNLLGRYYYNVAGLTWLEKTGAKHWLGCKLEGTYQDSEREFLAAHSLQTDWLPTGLWMARVLIAQKRPSQEVKRWIDFGLKLDCKEPSTELEREELHELRSKLKLSD